MMWQMLKKKGISLSVQTVRKYMNVELDSNLLHVKRRNTVIARDLRPITWQKIC